MKSRKSIELNERFNKRWLGYAASAGTAGVALLATTSAAWAGDIVYTQVNIPLTDPGFGLHIDQNQGFLDFIVNASSGGIGLQGRYVKSRLYGIFSGGGLVDKGAPLPRGAVIGPADSFQQSALLKYVYKLYSSGRGVAIYTRGGYWSGLGYLGFKFETSSGQTLYGWAELDVAPGFDAPIATLMGYAYDTVANQPLTAGQGQTPEPGTLGLLALGSLGLGFWRRKAVNSQQ